MSDQKKLFKAIENNKYYKVKKILTANQELVNVTNEYEETPLQIALERGYLKLAELLIENAGINAKGIDGKTPLQIALERDYLNFAKFLVEEKGADVNAKDKDGETPLQIALELGYLNFAKFLIENGADVNAKNKYGKTPLHEAAQEGHTNVAEFLIENGADVNAKDKYGNTPLYYAVEGNKISIIELIVKNIAKLEAAGLPVDEQNLQLKSEYISSSQERHNSYSEHFRECKEEIAKITRENKSLINFLKAENLEESEEIWVENESVRNAFDDQERLRKQYPKYADMLIHKANKVKKEIFLYNHEPLIDPLLKLCERNFNNMTFHDMAAFCNNKDLVIDDLRLPLTNFIDFGDVKAKHSASLKVQTFAKTVKISTAKTAEIYTIRIEKSKNVSAPLTDV